MPREAALRGGPLVTVSGLGQRSGIIARAWSIDRILLISVGSWLSRVSSPVFFLNVWQIGATMTWQAGGHVWEVSCGAEWVSG